MEKTKIGEIECLEAWVSILLFQAADEMNMKILSQANLAEKGEGDNPFNVCMRQSASHLGGNREKQRHIFGEAARRCAHESRNPRDLLPYYKQRSDELHQIMDDLLSIRQCGA